MGTGFSTSNISPCYPPFRISLQAKLFTCFRRSSQLRHLCPFLPMRWNIAHQLDCMLVMPKHLSFSGQSWRTCSQTTHQPGSYNLEPFPAGSKARIYVVWTTSHLHTMVELILREDRLGSKHLLCLHFLQFLFQSYLDSITSMHYSSTDVFS